MRKFPRASWMKQSECFDGVGSSVLFAILCCVCPPLGILFAWFYSLFIEGRNIDAQKIVNVLFFLSVGFIIVASPIVTVISLFKFGFDFLVSNYFILVLITLIEFIVGLVLAICCIKNRRLNGNTDKKR